MENSDEKMKRQGFKVLVLISIVGLRYSSQSRVKMSYGDEV